MNVLMLVADYAKITGDGRVNVLGIFNQIKAVQFPARHHSLWLIAKISLEIGERAIARPFEIRLLDQDGSSAFDLEGELPFQQVSDGFSPEVNIILPINNLVFPGPGIYDFRLYINGESKASVPIQVVQVDQPKSG
jgi:hypothetical protein